MKRPLCAALACIMLVGCAKHPNSIPAQYVSPLQYENHSCKQIGAEMEAVSARVTELAGQNEKAASNSDAVMGVGLVLFWPALFFLDSNSAQAAEYGRLKGEFDALEKASIEKNCGLHIERPKLPEPEQKKEEAPAYPTPGRKV
jgi:hypothetical protein